MPNVYVVRKVILLKILLAGIAGLCAYEYGYHPSAEEFDNLMRETRKTWTRDLLANERRRAWINREAKRRNGEEFYNYVPKYHYEKQRNRFDWPEQTGSVQKVHDRNDQQQSATNNVAASLDFSMFSDELLTSGAQFEQQKPNVFVQNKPTFDDDNEHTIFMDNVNIKNPYSPLKLKKDSMLTSKPTAFASTVATPLEMYENHVPTLTNPQKFPIPPYLNKNHTLTQLPIFFTNPTTGIVYAITEVGKVQENSTQANDTSIPIYVTKEQYDRDLYLLHKHYEHNCRKIADKHQFLNVSNSSTISAISASSNTTVRPQIIHLQGASAHNNRKQPAINAKIPKPLRKPPPVLVQTEVTVSDQIKLPTKRKKKLKTSNRKKKRPNKRPGRKPVALNLKEPTFPKIMLGTRPTDKPSGIHDNLKTQLEKPAGGTIFSNHPTTSTMYHQQSFFAAKTESEENLKNPLTTHKIRRRSLTKKRDFENKFMFTQNRTLNSWSPIIQGNIKPFAKEQTTLTEDIAGPPTQNGTVKFIERTSRKLSDSENTANRILRPNQPKLLVTNSPVNMSINITATLAKVVSSVPPKPTTKDIKTIENLSTARSAKRNTKKKSNKQTKRKSQSTDSDYDDYYFDLFGTTADDDNNDDDVEYPSDEDDYYYNIKYTTPESPHATIIDDDEHSDVDHSNDLKEETSQVNSSSAEESADYGAMDVEADIPDSQEMVTTHNSQVISNTKDTTGKIRIRRRPSSAGSSNSLEEYDDDYADDADSGIGGFFRMIFYPVQMLMGRLIDGIGGEKDSSVEETQTMPTYTLYHNAGNNVEAESEQGNSLSDWFSSWFGLNRRTKKIGSTTLAPPSEVTEESSWFSSWFNYGDSRTTTEASYEDYDDDKSFFGWFDFKPKTKQRRSTTTTTTSTTPIPQVPILTIVDPMRNPQNWIGLLAHSIMNATSTSSSTHHPLIDAFTRATTTTTTENPDIPRKISYDKYQIWRLKPQDDGQVKVIEDYKNSNDGSKLQWLKGPSLRGLNDVLVPPKMIIDFQGTLDFESIAHEVLIFDVGKVIAYEKSKEHYIYTTTHHPHKQNNKKNAQLTMSWNKYYEYDDIVKYLESMRLRHPQMVELIHIGRSYEGRPLIIVKIESKKTTSSTAANAAINRKKLKFKKKSGQANAVFIEAGTHGMEWIAPATSTWMISELVRIMKSNSTNVEEDFIKNITWYILPVLNPDGYVYSHEFDRFWKKSRSRHISRPGGIITSAMTWLQQKKAPEKVCYGVDLDRNWQYQWGRRGSSKSPCNEIFAGPLPFSEPETKALAAFLIDNRKNLKLYISLQAYGQILSYPKKVNESFNSDRMDDLLDVAMVGTDWLRKKGSKSRYKVDSTSDLIESRSGCSDAFAAYEVGVPFSYTLQLADNGVHGYLLPSSSIESTARDAFEIITAMIDYI